MNINFDSLFSKENDNNLSSGNKNKGKISGKVKNLLDQMDSVIQKRDSNGVGAKLDPQKMKYLRELRAKLQKNPKNYDVINKEYDVFYKNRQDVSNDVNKITRGLELKNLQLKSSLKDVKNNISEPLRYFTDKSMTITEILEKVLAEIIEDKVKLENLRVEKQNTERELGRLKDKVENLKVGYKRMIDENEEMRKENRDIIDKYERQITQTNDLDALNKQYEHKTREIFDSRNAVQTKLKKVEKILEVLDGRMGGQLKEFEPDSTSFEEILRERGMLKEGGAVSSSMDRKIMKKLKIDDIKMLDIVSGFYKKTFLKKTELLSIARIFDIPHKTSDKKSTIMSKILKRFKLTKKQVEYLKTR